MTRSGWLLTVGKHKTRRTVRKRTSDRKGFDLARHLRQLRHALDLTQEAVAQRAGVTAKFVSQVENNHASPTFRVVLRLVQDGLGVSLAEFFCGDTGPRDEVAKIHALLAGQPLTVKRKALELVRALLKS